MPPPPRKAPTSGACLIRAQGGARGLREDLLAAQLGMVATDGDRDRAADGELEVLDRRQLALGALPLVDGGTHERPVGEAGVEVLGQADPAHELLGALERIVQFDEQRATEVAALADQLVVGVELVADVRFLDDAFGAHHLVHLVADRLVVLEQEGEDARHVGAAQPLGRHRRRAQLGAALAVRDVVEDLRSLDALHVRSA
jgi:hypothetical protein